MADDGVVTTILAAPKPCESTSNKPTMDGKIVVTTIYGLIKVCRTQIVKFKSVLRRFPISSNHRLFSRLHSTRGPTMQD